MSIDDPRPSILTAEHLAEDLSLSNEEATSWFVYRLGATPGTIEADLLTELGEVEKTFTVLLAITPVSDQVEAPTPDTRAAADAALAAVDAPQPGQAAEYVRGGVCLLCGGGVLASGEHLDDQRHADAVERIVSGRGTTIPAVRQGVHEREVMDLIARRDELHEIADELAARLAPPDVLGEHSSDNDPWQNALDYATGWHSTPEAADGSNRAVPRCSLCGQTPREDPCLDCRAEANQ